MNFMQLVKSLISRLMFFGHGLISVYLLYSNTGDKLNWIFALPLVFLLVEIAVTIGYRKGKEYKYFWPSGFLYILTIIPIIWVIEIDILNKRIAKEQNINITSGEFPNQRILDIQVADAYFSAFQLSNEVVGKNVCELGLIIGLIAGRWLMPRGEITRDQLSALLLGYVGNAADILELFETFEEPDIIYERSVTIGVIAVYSWSIFQFTLVTTATVNDKKDDDVEKQIKIKLNKVSPNRKASGSDVQHNNLMKQKYIQEIKTTKNSSKGERGKGKKASLTDKNSKKIRKLSKADEKVRRRALHGEVFQILVTIIMQDGPFLILRLYLIVQFNVTSEMHIFFTCKNAIVSILLVYRLCILTCRGEDEETNWHREEAASKLKNVQLAILSTHIEDKDAYKMDIK